MSNKPVSPIIIFILAILITIAIAVTSYMYTSGMLGGYSPKIFSGTITEKFRMGDYPSYYFVLDNKFDIKVNETIYYEYDVGDFYEGKEYRY